jgi:hypothetical protein
VEIERSRTVVPPGEQPRSGLVVVLEPVAVTIVEHRDHVFTAPLADPRDPGGAGGVRLESQLTRERAADRGVRRSGDKEQQ